MNTISRIQAIFPNRTRTNVFIKELLKNDIKFGCMPLPKNNYFEVMVFQPVDNSLMEFIKTNTATYRIYKHEQIHH